MKTIHSPLPWDIAGKVGVDLYVHAANRVCNIPKPSGYYQSPGEQEANARFIVQACNAHDAMREALERIENVAGDERVQNTACLGDRGVLKQLAQIAKDALARGGR